MKKLLLALLIGYYSNIIAQPTTLTCNVAFAISDSCSLRIDKFHNNEFDTPIISLIKNKSVTYNLSINVPSILDWMYNNQLVRVWLEPNDNLTLSFTNDSLHKDIKQEGKAAINNQFLAAFMTTFKSDFDKNNIKQSILSSGIDAFENHLFNEQKKQLSFFNNYSDKSKFTAAFNTYIANSIKYNYYYQLYAYPIITANENKGLTVTPLPELLIEKVNSTLINNDEALNCEAYRNFLYYYDIYYTSKLNGFNKFTDNSISMEKKVAIANQSITGKANIYFIANFLNENVQSVSPFTAKHVYGILVDAEKNGDYSKLLKAKCEKVIHSKVKEEQKSEKPDNAANDSSGDIKILGTDGKYFKLSDLKGKVVYVDFWASWCGPCRSMFPYSKELHKKFTPKQLKSLVFLYISIDKNDDVWKKGLEQNGLDEFKNGLVPGDWSSEIVQYFHINSIPRYMLIDKKGNIVDINAKRPADPAVYDDIIKLIE